MLHRWPVHNAVITPNREKIEMHFTSVLLAILLIGLAFETSDAQQTVKKADDGPRVEFYVARRFQPAPKYRVKSFRLVGKNSPELAARFRGLAAQDLESGEYEYVLAPEIEPAGPRGAFVILGRASLYGPYAYWITLQTPTGSSVDGTNMSPLSGRVIGASNGRSEPLWIRFQHAVDQSQIVQAKLGGDGIFEIPNSIPFTGSVIVTVCSGAGVLFLDLVHFTGGKPEHPMDFRLRANPL